MSDLHARILPPTEWPRLRAIEPFASRGLPDDPRNWVVLVVEHLTGTGQVIVGTCSLYTAMHWDAWFIDPALPGPTRGVILRQLLRLALTALRDGEVSQVYTGVEAGDQAPQLLDLLTRFGFHQAGEMCVLSVADAAAAVVGPED